MTFFDDLAKYEPLQTFLGLSENQQKALYDRGLVLRFFALKNDLDEFKHDVEPFITEYVHKVVDKEAASSTAPPRRTSSAARSRRSPRR